MAFVFDYYFDDTSFTQRDEDYDRMMEARYQAECDDDEFLSFERRHGANPEGESDLEEAVRTVGDYRQFDADELPYELPEVA